jgi:flagellar motility protein MotE (MotC chaperone)
MVAGLAHMAVAQDGRPAESQNPRAAVRRVGADKPAVAKAAEIEASRYCANIAPSFAEARIAWQAKRLSELDAQLKQRIADLEKAEASAREWIAKREALMGAASADLVTVYAKMNPESAAKQISAMDDRVAAAILAKLKPGAAGAILGEMEADRASRLAGLIAGGERKS